MPCFSDYHREVAMKLSKKVVVFTAVAAASAGAAVSLAGSAGASVRTAAPGGPPSLNCAFGVYAGYCGTTESATNLLVGAGPHGQVIGVRHPQSQSTQFVWIADAGLHAANNDKFAVYAPNGVPTDLVIAEEHGHVVLEPASGAPNQKWVYNANDGWSNVQTSDVLKTTVDGGPILAVHGPSTGLSETFHWVPGV
jgi:hypothetical protein